MSRYYENCKDTIKDDLPANVLCTIAAHFQSFLLRALQLTNENLKIMVNFTIMSGDFIEFVSAYQSNDSITVQHGYLWFAPIWKILGQVKYLEATREQMDALYESFPYSQLQEAHMNRQVQMYPGSTKKSTLAQDEWLELNNKEFSNFPSVRTLGHELAGQLHWYDTTMQTILGNSLFYAGSALPHAGER